MEFDPILVHEWLVRTATKYSEKTAVVCDKRRLSYRELDEMSDNLAVRLKDIGIDHQDRIAIMLENSIETVVAIYAILKAGGIFVPLNPGLKANKLSYILKNADARILITHVLKSQLITDVATELDGMTAVIWVGAKERIPGVNRRTMIAWDDVISPNTARSEKKSQNRCLDMDLAALIYTSGTSGLPKGVMQTHQNMISVSRSIIQYLDIRDEDVVLDVLPLSFSYGLYQVLMSVMCGGTVVLERSFMYVADVLKKIVVEKVTGFPMVPTMATLMLKIENLKDYDFSSIRYITNAGDALPTAHIRKLRSMFPHIKIFLMYGQTECARMGYLPPEEIDNRPESVGRAMPNSEAYIVDEAGRPVSNGEQGELVIRGSNVMSGYWRDEEQTAKAFRCGTHPGDRLLFTGDLFRTDADGYLYFVSRRENMIKIKGERISAIEVENTINMLEGIVETAVVGVPDEILGQAVKAYVVPSPGYDLTAQKVLAHCTVHLESFAIPKYVIFVDSLPRTPNGKLDRKQLLEQE